MHLERLKPGPADDGYWRRREPQTAAVEPIDEAWAGDNPCLQMLLGVPMGAQVRRFEILSHDSSSIHIYEWEGGIVRALLFRDRRIVRHKTFDQPFQQVVQHYRDRLPGTQRQLEVAS